MSAEFARRWLRFTPSLNRMILADLPGAPAGVAGTRANDWLTTWSIARHLAADADLLEEARGIRPGLATLPSAPEVTAELMDAAIDYPAALDALLAPSGRPRTDPASALAQRLGTILGLLLATVTIGPEETRRAHGEWPAQHWERWAEVRRIALGGGVLRGRLGVVITDSASRFLADLASPARLVLVDDPRSLVLRGAAHRIGEGVALDCGGSTIKRAVAHRGRPGDIDTVPAPGRVAAEEVIETIAVAAAPLIATWPGPDPVPLSLAIATYVDPDGQPYADQLGPYAPLGNLDAPAALRAASTRHTDRAVEVLLAHDGASALSGARAEAPDTDAAVVLGTALGSGLA